MDREEFERHVREALEAVPERFRAELKNVAFVVEDATEAGLREPDSDLAHCELLGLHEGNSIIERPPDPTGTLPNKITLFRDVIEDEADDSGDDLALVIRETVWHEIAHYFGYEEDDATRLERRWEEEWERLQAKAGLAPRSPKGEVGFSLIELVVTVGIIGVLATIVIVAVGPARVRSRDRLRIAQIDLLGRYLLASDCYAPSGGTGDYDLKTLYDEAVAAKPEIAQFLSSAPRDPRSGDATQSGFRYAYESGAKACALYANLEDEEASVTLPDLTAPTPGGGRGVLQAAQLGPNGSNRYYQTGR